jgi:hypothetical protein
MSTLELSDAYAMTEQGNALVYVDGLLSPAEVAAIIR